MKDLIDTSDGCSCASGSRSSTSGCGIKAHMPRQHRNSCCLKSENSQNKQEKKNGKVSLSRQIERSVEEFEYRV